MLVCSFSTLMVEGHMVEQSFLPPDSQEERERRGEDMGDERWTNKISLRSIKMPYFLQLNLAP